MQINRKIACLFLALIPLGTIYLLRTPAIPVHDNVKLVSEINGYYAWQTERSIYPQQDVEAFITGVRACANGKSPPNNMSLHELLELTQEIEFQAHRKQINENLVQSEAFLAEIAQKPQIVTMRNKQVYYEIVAEGEGEPLVTASSTPLLHYSVALPDSTILCNTRDKDEPEAIPLDSVIPGFTQGVLGMKKGEKRRLYIHPNQAYRTMHWSVPPNMALIFDVELLDVN